MRKHVKTLMLVVIFHLMAGSFSFANTTITYWSFVDPNGSGPRVDVQNYAIQKFEERNPGVKVQVEVLAWQMIPNSLILGNKAKTGPDLVRVFEPDFRRVASTGALHSLDEFVEDWAEDEKSDWVSPWSATEYNGRKYGFFWDTRVRNLWYRADLLEEAGLGVPVSLDELMHHANVLAEDNLVGLLLPLHRQPSSAMAEWLLPVVVGAGGQLLNEDGTAAFDQLPVIKVFEWLKKAIQENEGIDYGASQMSGEEQQEVFAAGRAAFWISGSHRVETVRSTLAAGKVLKTAAIPGFDHGIPSPAWTTGWILAVGAHSKQKELAFELLQTFLEHDVQLKSSALAGEMPARASVLKDPWFLTEDAEEIKGFLEYAKDHPMDAVLPLDWTRMSDELHTALEEMISRDMEPREALERAKQRFDERI